MTSKYCDDCEHEKKSHKDRKYKYKVQGCNCKRFERGPRRLG